MLKKRAIWLTINYETTMNTICGELEFSNTITMTREIGKDYTVKWNSKAIFPELTDKDKLRVKTIKSKRGDIIDRNGAIIATDSCFI